MSVVEILWDDLWIFVFVFFLGVLFLEVEGVDVKVMFIMFLKDDGLW